MALFSFSVRTICFSSETCLWNLNNQDGILSLRALHFHHWQTLHGLSQNGYGLSDIRAINNIESSMPLALLFKEVAILDLLHRTHSTSPAIPATEHRPDPANLLDLCLDIP